jgi:hypothetical protein
MHKKTQIALSVNILIALNIYAIVVLADFSHPEVDAAFKPRFICLIIIHAIIFLSMLIMLLLNSTYSYMVLILINCLISVAAFSIT